VYLAVGDTYTKRFRVSEVDQGYFAMGSEIASDDINPIETGSHTIGDYLRTLDLVIQLGTKDSTFCTTHSITGFFTNGGTGFPLVSTCTQVSASDNSYYTYNMTVLSD